MKGFITNHFGLFMSLAVIFGIMIGAGSLFFLNYCFANQYVYYIVCFVGLFLILTLFGLLFDLANRCKVMGCPNNCCKCSEPQNNHEKQKSNKNEGQPDIVENEEKPLQKQPTKLDEEVFPEQESNLNQTPTNKEEVNKSQPQNVNDVPQDEIVERKQIIKVKKVIGKDIDDLILKKMKQQERENKENETK